MLTTRTKICGITSVEDAHCVGLAGADAMGIVFYEPSPRAVMDLGLAREIAMAAGPFVSTVALFVNADAGDVERVLEHVPINCIQFHGDEAENFCSRFHRPYIKALRMNPNVDIALQAASYSSASAILCDTYVKGTPGGTGQAFDWATLPNLHKPIVLAGGLHPLNVAQAIRATQPYAVDVSGGVEYSPGKKDPQKIHEFIANVRMESEK